MFGFGQGRRAIPSPHIKQFRLKIFSFPEKFAARTDHDNHEELIRDCVRPRY
jgi:hypothetical protein